MIHQRFMSQALQLAERGRCSVSPNPMVGCLIVKDAQVIAEGFHQVAGMPHAEIYALQAAGEDAKEATAYVTLEPCCHYGKTPPCTKALINAGIKKVYVACLDPNPLVAGKGVAELREAGIEVVLGIGEEEAKKLNEIFFHYIQHKRPFVIAKWAMSLDGKTKTNPHDSRLISSPDSQQFAHQVRQQVDAILIGANTARSDNPLLTARVAGEAIKQPLRIVLASRHLLPLDLHLFQPTDQARTLVVVTENIDQQWCDALLKQQVAVMLIKANSAGRVDLSALLIELGKRAISSLLVEGGMTTHHAFFQEQLVNQIHVYLAPVIIADLEKKQPFNHINLTPLNGDYFISAT